MSTKTSTKHGDKPQRPPADPAVRTQRLYRRLHDQLAQDLFANALKTVNKLLLLNPSDPLALRTHSQLLIALDRFSDALKTEGTDELSQAYCLYKLGRPADAQKKLLEVKEEGDEEEDRAKEVLQAQLHYRLGEFEAARDAFDDLAATAEEDSPETADLQANLHACTSQLDFLSSVPSTLSSLNPPSIEELESRPLALVLPSSSTRKPFASASAAAAAEQQQQKKKRRSRPLPPRAQDGIAPPPPEDRWIPKRQRPSMRDALLHAKEKARGRKRDKVLLTQGAAEPVEVHAKPSTPAKGGKSGGGGGGGGKKKKGKR